MKETIVLNSWTPGCIQNGDVKEYLEARWESVQTRYPGKVVYAWCKPGSLPLLLEKGFETGEICTYVEKKIE